ncbi:MAG: SpaA isopeptide-forming pilin-related protein, partial [Clostridia bacterium]|nr:SpaA isopeptide-forming pilin-related protein [Clostridia bacterium]
MAAAVAGWALGEIFLSEGGQLHYVPQAGQSQALAQRYTLAVRGMSRGEINGPPVAQEYLSGAVFGIYAPDAEGNMQPWPDPRAPHSPFLVRTQAEPVSFDLPDGLVFFMRQVSAPEGYMPIPEGYWSIEGLTELRVDNAMPGGLEVLAADTDGQPLAGVQVRLLQEGQLVQEGVTGADGAWQVDPLPAGDYVIENTEPPQDFLPATDPRRDVTVRDGALAGDTFVHQRMGRVLVLAESVAMRSDGQLERAPLTDMGLQVLDGNRRSVAGEWSTDANGLAQSALPAGSYVLRVAQLDSETEFSITDGQDTELNLLSEAQEGYIRFALTGGLPDQLAVPLVGVRCTLWQGNTLIGEYITDASGQAVTPALAPGNYAVRYEGLPEGYALPDRVRGGETLTLKAASLAESLVLCPPVLTGRYTVGVGEIDENGELIELPVGQADFAVLNVDGSPVSGAEGAPLQVRSGPGGEIELSLPAGEYLLQPPMGRQALAHALEEPVAFSLPQEQETILLRAKLTRLIVGSVGQDGA